MVNPFNRSLLLPWVTGAWDTQTVTGLAKLSKEIGRQAAMLGYINAFGLYTLASALAIPLVLMVSGRSRARSSVIVCREREISSGSDIRDGLCSRWPLG